MMQNFSGSLADRRANQALGPDNGSAFGDGHHGCRVRYETLDAMYADVNNGLVA